MTNRGGERSGPLTACNEMAGGMGNAMTHSGGGDVLWILWAGCVTICVLTQYGVPGGSPGECGTRIVHGNAIVTASLTDVAVRASAT